MLHLIIDTTSRESMERDMTAYLDITTNELYRYIDNAAEKAESLMGFSTEKFNQEIFMIIDAHKPSNPIDEVLCFHLSRRLNMSSNDLRLYNLRELLLGDNDLVQYLKEHNIIFKEQGSHLVLFYQGRKISLEDTTELEVCYLRSRLGYNYGRQDFCLNGFVMGDQLLKNMYTRDLFEGPEFLAVLSCFLKNKTIINDFKKASTYFFYTLKIPIDEVIFDGLEEFDNNKKELYLVTKIFNRLLMYNDSSFAYFSDDDNPIIRMGDNVILPETCMVGREKITLEMIK